MFPTIKFQYKPRPETLREMSIFDPDFALTRFSDLFYHLKKGDMTERLAAAECVHNLAIYDKTLGGNPHLVLGIIINANTVDCRIRQYLINAAGRTVPMIDDRTQLVLRSYDREVVKLLSYDSYTSMWAQPIIKEISKTNPKSFTNHTKEIARTVYSKDQILARDAIHTLFAIGKESPKSIKPELNPLLYYLKNGNRMVSKEALKPIAVIGKHYPQSVLDSGIVKIIDSIMDGSNVGLQIEAIRAVGVMTSEHPHKFEPFQMTLLDGLSKDLPVEKETTMAILRIRNKMGEITHPVLDSKMLKHLMEKHDIVDFQTGTETSINPPVKHDTSV